MWGRGVYIEPPESSDAQRDQKRKRKENVFVSPVRDQGGRDGVLKVEQVSQAQLDDGTWASSAAVVGEY